MRIRTYQFLLLIVFIAIQIPGKCQDTLRYSQENEVKESGLVPIPIIFYTPETTLAFGGGLINVFKTSRDDSLTSVSNIRSALIYTLRNQILLNLDHDIFIKQNKYRMIGQLVYVSFPDYFYGIGNNTSVEDEENYSNNILSYKIQPLYQVFPKFYVGLQYNLQYMFGMKYKEGGMLESGEIFGTDGGLSSGIGFSVLFDKRDYPLNCTKGYYLEWSTRHFREWLGSDYDLNIWELDARYYLPIHPGHIIAFQYAGKFTNGDVPFYQLAQLGGDKVMRGHYRGRYRDNNLMAFQTEYRWQFFKKFGMTIFAGFGDVSDDFNNFEISEFKYSFGAGLRYAVVPSQRINVRLDVGFGEKTQGFYINIAEAF